MANLRQVKQKHRCNKIQQARKILDTNRCDKRRGRRAVSDFSAIYRMFNTWARVLPALQKEMSMKKTLFSALGLAVALAFSAPMIGSADAATVTTKTVVKHPAHHHHHHHVRHHHVRHHHHHHAKHVVVKKVVKKG